MSGPKSPVSVNYKVGPYWKLIFVVLSLYGVSNLISYATKQTFVPPEDALAGAWRALAWGIRWGVAAWHKLRSS